MSKKRLFELDSPNRACWCMISQFRLAWKLFRDDRVPRSVKAIPDPGDSGCRLATRLALNLIPVIGQMGDLAVIGLGVNTFVKAAPPEVVHEYMAELNMEQLHN